MRNDRQARRRRLLLGISAAAAAPRLFAQAPGRTYRIGWLATGNTFAEPYGAAFARRLAELGFVEGRNLVLERRHGENQPGRLPAVAAELAKAKHDLIFTAGPEATLSAAVQASRDVPVIVIAIDFDPVATGDVASLARPGGRVSGMTALQSALPAKRLELLKEMIPGISRVAVLANEQTGAQLSLAQGTARRLGITPQVIDLKRPPFDFGAAVAEAARARAEAIFVLGSALWVPARLLLPELALKAKLPTVFHQAQWVEAGGLMSYGFNFPAMFRRGAEMAVEVLKGAKPATMPMEQPASYELALNLKTAKSLGLNIPTPLKMRADQVVQ
jgi:putative tryptophan/tyrosine transport system substrate-binding protein